MHSFAAQTLIDLLAIIFSIVAASILLGGAQIINALTGVNVIATSFLIPITLAAYVLLGGLRATFVSDYTVRTLLDIQKPIANSTTLIACNNHIHVNFKILHPLPCFQVEPF